MMVREYFNSPDRIDFGPTDIDCVEHANRAAQIEPAAKSQSVAARSSQPGEPERSAGRPRRRATAIFLMLVGQFQFRYLIYLLYA